MHTKFLLMYFQCMILDVVLLFCKPTVTNEETLLCVGNKIAMNLFANWAEENIVKSLKR